MLLAIFPQFWLTWWYCSLFCLFLLLKNHRCSRSLSERTWQMFVFFRYWITNIIIMRMRMMMMMMMMAVLWCSSCGGLIWLWLQCLCSPHIQMRTLADTQWLHVLICKHASSKVHVIGVNVVNDVTAPAFLAGIAGIHVSKQPTGSQALMASTWKNSLYFRV